MNTVRQRCARVLRGVARRLDAPASPAGGTGYAQTDPFFDCLRTLGFAPDHIVDVGANTGLWTRTALRYFPSARYSLFEPQGHLLEGSDLASHPGVSIFAMGAGPRTATMRLTKHARHDSYSFALSEAAATQAGREQVDAPVVALDEFLPSRGLPYPNILKVDAEGWDLEVLKGAEASAAHADVVLLEAAVMHKSFANRLDLVVADMCRRGFVPFDITHLNRTRRHGALWLVEVAFVKKGGDLESAVATYA